MGYDIMKVFVMFEATDGGMEVVKEEKMVRMVEYINYNKYIPLDSKNELWDWIRTDPAPGEYITFGNGHLTVLYKNGKC